jgi:hypothetical protein
MVTSAPSSFTTSSFRALEAVANTRAPKCFASRTAAWPTPPAAAWISTDCPALTSATSRMAAYAVNQLMPTAAPSAGLHQWGSGRAMTARQVMNSAKAPWPKAITFAPIGQGMSPPPVATTSPHASRPAMYGGVGPPRYVPRVCIESEKFTPAARTLISTSPAWGGRTGRSTIRIAAGPSRLETSTACMVLGIRMTSLLAPVSAST